MTTFYVYRQLLIFIACSQLDAMQRVIFHGKLGRCHDYDANFFVTGGCHYENVATSDDKGAIITTTQGFSDCKGYDKQPLLQNALSIFTHASRLDAVQ